MADTNGNTLTITAAELIANDVGKDIHVIHVGTPTNGGSVAFDGALITYTVDPAFLAAAQANSTNVAQTVDTFPYTIQDSAGKTDTATVTIDISRFGPTL